jgi:vitamin K-dependent gamma-carboxylase
MRCSPQSYTKRLFEPVDIAWLVFFRVIFGSLLLWEVCRYFQNGWIESHFIEPTFHFTYPGFDWIRPWPGVGMYFHFVLLGLLAFCILAGLCYRVSTTLFAVGFWYVFLLDQTNYLNHFYLIGLLSLLLVFLPANRAFSLDVLRGSVKPCSIAPAWSLALLRFQIGIVYFFGGIAKLNADWLRGEPMRTWLAARTDFPLIGRWFTEEPVVALFNYGGLLLDLLIVPLLLWRRTRLCAFGVATLFHLMNAMLFSIGIFPWFMIAATALFFDPSWARRLFSWRHDKHVIIDRQIACPSPYRVITATLLGCYALVQCLVPLRHYVYEGDVNWTDKGHKFSWRMKLRDKHGRATFLVLCADTGRFWQPPAQSLLTDRQARKMAARPHLILQFAKHLAHHARGVDIANPRVHACVEVSLNGRPFQPIIDPSVNLAHEARRMKLKEWTIPLDPSA